MTGPNAYAQAGVDVDIEAKASAIMYEASKLTWRNRAGFIGEIETPRDDFAGMKIVHIGNLPAGSCLNIGSDGAGTKPAVAELTGVPDTIGIDLIAMVADDAVQKGAEPAIVANVLDIATLGSDERHLPKIQDLADGLVAGAKLANVAVMNGEIAQMGARVSGHGDFPFNWSASCICFFREDRILTGAKIQAGDAIVLFKEHGFRCNGFSLVSKVFRERYGDDWQSVHFGDSTLGAQVLEPSTIYTRAIIAAHGGFASYGECDIHGVAHITGGGIPEKLGRLLRPAGLGAHIFDPYEMPAIMRHCQEAGHVCDADAYRAWNGGQGMAVVAPKGQTDRVIACASRFGIEAKVGGEIVEKSGVRIVSRGAEAFGAKLEF